LAPAIRQAHEVHGVLVLEGKADAESPNHILGALIARLFRLPRSGSNMPVRVEIPGRISSTRFSVRCRSVCKGSQRARLAIANH
jgi:hypothetical protein